MLTELEAAGGAAGRAAGGAARGAAREASPWLIRGARLGFAANGAVYVLVGLLALQAAASAGGETTDKRGALQSIADWPGGTFILALLALGLVGYGAWRIVEAATDAEGHGRDAKGLAVRAAHGAYGVIYALLALAAARLAMGNSSGGGSASGTESWTARLLALPAGKWLVIAAGLAIVAFGVGQLVRAAKADVTKRLDLHDLDAGQREWVVRLGRLGHAARGVVFGIVGWFLVRAAMQHDAEQAGGLGDALSALQAAPYGKWLLGVVALGLVAYGLFNIVRARYRTIDV